MIKLTAAALKQLFRDKEAIFWSLIFPLIFILIFKLFDFSGSLSANIVIIDQAQNQLSNTITSALTGIDGVAINKDFTEVESAKSALQEATKVDFKFANDKDEQEKRNEAPGVVIFVPAGYGTTTYELQVFYNQASEGASSPSSIVASIIDEITTGYVLQVNNVQDPFSVDRQGVAVNDIRYYDLLVPGIIAMSIMQSGIIGMASSMAAMKEKRILKRLSATPLPIWKFILAQVISFVILALLQVSVMLVTAKVFLGANIYGSVPLIYLISFLGVFVFLSIGFIAAALSKTATSAASLAQVFTTPMMFLSGVFFPRETLPAVVRTISDFLPLSPMIDALRDVALQNGSLADQAPKLLAIGVWTLICFLIAARLFKFREE